MQLANSLEKTAKQGWSNCSRPKFGKEKRGRSASLLDGDRAMYKGNSATAEKISHLPCRVHDAKRQSQCLMREPSAAPQARLHGRTITRR